MKFLARGSRKLKSQATWNSLGPAGVDIGKPESPLANVDTSPAYRSSDRFQGLDGLPVIAPTFSVTNGDVTTTTRCDVSFLCHVSHGFNMRRCRWWNSVTHNPGFKFSKALALLPSPRLNMFRSCQRKNAPAACDPQLRPRRPSPCIVLCGTASARVTPPYGPYYAAFPPAPCGAGGLGGAVVNPHSSLCGVVVGFGFNPPPSSPAL